MNSYNVRIHFIFLLYWQCSIFSQGVTVVVNSRTTQYNGEFQHRKIQSNMFEADPDSHVQQESFCFKAQAFFKLMKIFPCLGINLVNHSKAQLARLATCKSGYISHLCFSAWQSNGVSSQAIDLNQSVSLLSFHFVSLYFSELKACEQREDMLWPLPHFPLSLLWIMRNQASGVTDRVRLITGRLDGCVPWVSGSLSRAAVSCDLAIPLFTLQPHKVWYKP